MLLGFFVTLAISLSLADFLGNIANIIFTIGSSIKNAFYLRFAIVIGGVFENVYFFMIAENPLWTSIFWTTLLIGINSYFIAVHYYEKYSLELDESEKKLYYSIFSTLDVSTFHKFMKVSNQIEVQSEEYIVQEGEYSDQLYLLTEGMAEVIVNNKTVAFINDGTFVGEMSFLSGNVPTATVKTTIPSTLITWNKEDVKKMSEIDTGFGRKLQHLLSTDVIVKLTKQNRAE